MKMVRWEQRQNLDAYHGYQPKITFLLQVRLDLGAAPAGGVRYCLDQKAFANSKLDALVIGA